MPAMPVTDGGPPAASGTGGTGGTGGTEVMSSSQVVLRSSGAADGTQIRSSPVASVNTTASPGPKHAQTRARPSGWYQAKRPTVRTPFTTRKTLITLTVKRTRFDAVLPPSSEIPGISTEHPMPQAVCPGTAMKSGSYR